MLAIHGIFQARYLRKWLPFLSSGNLPDPGIEPTSPAFAGGFFTTKALDKSYRKNKASFIVTAGI